MIHKRFKKTHFLAIFTTIIIISVSSNIFNVAPALGDINCNISNKIEISTINISFESNTYTLYGEIYYPTDNTTKYPGIVFCEGFGGYIDAYNWIPKSIAEHGYITMIFDFPGQGYSEGIFQLPTLHIAFLNLYIRFGTIIETPLHYFLRHWVQATQDAITYLTEQSPLASQINLSQIGIIGHSLGGITVTETASQDSRVKTVVALSQGNPRAVSNINIPIQFQAGCLDLSTMSVPIVEKCYKKASIPKELIAIQAGTHLGFTTAFNNLCPCPQWQKDICIHYAVGWFDYFLKNNPDGYETITTGVDHLSTIIKSRYDFGDGEQIIQ